MFTYTCEMVNANNFPVIELNNDIYAGEHAPVLDIKTYYEQQWLERGLQIKYISFRPITNKILIEPEIEITPDPYRSFKRFRRQQ